MGSQHHTAAATEFRHKCRSLVLLSRPPHAGPFCRPDINIPAGDQPCMPNFSLDFLQGVATSISYPHCFSFDWYSREWPLADQGDKYFFNWLGGLEPQHFNMSSLVWNACSLLCEACWAILKLFITPVKMIKNTNKKKPWQHVAGRNTLVINVVDCPYSQWMSIFPGHQLCT